jgi:hypothetical protein
LELAGVLSELLPAGVSGSISTVPGSYKAWMRTDADRTAVVENLMSAVRHLAQLRQRTGKEIHLGLEPEPDCFVESTAEAVAFFEEHLLEEGADSLSARGRSTREEAAADIRRHLGICFDTCHLSLQYEELTRSLTTLRERGIRISKMQISAAPATRALPENLESLKALADPVYLHQVKARDRDGRVHSRGDMAGALAESRPSEAMREPESGSSAGVEEWRVHCHVPLYYEGDRALASTASELTPAFFSAARACGVEHFEIETYTFHVLPESVRGTDVVDSLVQEFTWVMRRFEQSADAPLPDAPAVESAGP